MESMKNIFNLFFALLLTNALFADEETCAIMVGDEIDTEEFT